MNAIAAVSSEWGIGFNNELLYNIPEDKKFFRSMTTGKTIIMGRKTLESMPGGKPLKNRLNIVLSRNEDYSPEGVTVCHSVNELGKIVKDMDRENIFIIGGAEVYNRLLPFCHKIYLTKIFDSKQADAFFPNLDKQYEWKLTDQSEIKEYEGLKYQFRTYTDISHL